MESVGIRQFKENMGHYVDLLRSGQDIILPDRKKQIAKIMPVGMSATEEAVRQMVLDGKAAGWVGGRPQVLQDRVRIKGKGVADAVVEDAHGANCVTPHRMRRNLRVTSLRL